MSYDPINDALGGDCYAIIEVEKELRLEAQKWVEHYKRKRENTPQGLDQCSPVVIDWIEMFFNLKEGGK